MKLERKFIIPLAVLAVLAVIGIAMTVSRSPATSHTASHAHSTCFPHCGQPTPVPVAAPEPSPDGKYGGSCDYSLSTSFYGTDHFTGEVTLRNIGNIGTVVRVKVGWPQYGYGYIFKTKTVRTKPGSRVTVRFHFPVSESQLSLMQDWQIHHGFAENNGCKIKAAMINTFGSPS